MIGAAVQGVLKEGVRLPTENQPVSFDALGVLSLLTATSPDEVVDLFLIARAMILPAH
jgi:hypothetical protein